MKGAPHFVDEKEGFPNCGKGKDVFITNSDVARAKVIDDGAATDDPLKPYTGILWKIINGLGKK